MANNQLAVQRLMRERQKMEADPNPHFIATPSPQNIFEWHFVLYNFAEDSPFKSGQFHGIIQVPVEYPLKPPALMFNTPQGRFKIGEKICLSFTNFHPESWSTSWTISAMLIGLISFMHTEERTVGGVESHSSQKKLLAQKSIQYNLNNPRFVEVFAPHFTRLGLKEDTTVVIAAPAPQIVEESNNQDLLLDIEPNHQKKKMALACLLILAIVAIVILVPFFI